MIAGTFGLAAIIKGRQPQLPFWALVLASQLLNIIFLTLNAAGIEKYTWAGSVGYGHLSTTADYSYSLVGALIVSWLVVLVALFPWGRRNALILGGVVFASWLLNLIVHRADLAILPPGIADWPRIGLSLWALPWLSTLLELALVLTGAFLYYHAAMRAAVRAERADAKEGRTPSGTYRRQALLSSIVVVVLGVAVLAANVLLGY